MSQVANTGKLLGKTIFVTGGSRGIGLSIAKKAAADGANVIIAAKTAEPHPTLPGTIYTAADEIEQAGGKCLPCVVDIRDYDQVANAVKQGVDKFGGIDILINNASAISLTPTLDTTMKKYDLMNQVNARGTFLSSQVCLPHLLKSPNAHILNISPPLNMRPFWFKGHVAYTMAKYGMSMCVLGMAEEFRDKGVKVNALWPRTAIGTAAMDMLGGDDIRAQCRKDTIMSDAAYCILTQENSDYTGQFLIDDNVLRANGVTDMGPYAEIPGTKDEDFMPDFFLDLDVPVPEQAVEASKDKTLKSEKPATSSSSSGQGSERMSAVFSDIKNLLNPDIVQSIRATYEFQVTDDKKNVTHYFIDLKNGAGAADQGKLSSDPDAIFKVSEDNFLKMFKGELSPTKAFMFQKLKIDGKMGKALKLENLMKQMQK
eukprot:Nk52_evm24s136 gene=Nk52_evmTU24s136